MKRITTLFLAGLMILSAVVPASVGAQSASSASSVTMAPLVSESCIFITENLSLGKRDTRTNGSVINLQAFLNEYGFLTVQPTGYFGVLTLQAVKTFQAQYSLPVTGFFGPLSRAVMQKVSCSDTTPTNRDIKVSVATDKSNYNSNDVVKVTITATNLSNREVKLDFSNSCQTSFTLGQYNYLMDKLCAMAMSSVSIPAFGTKSWELTHDLGVYPLNVGTNLLKAEVVGHGTASMNVVIGSSNQPSVTVLTPNHGETVVRGQTQQITWKSYMPFPTFAALTYKVQLRQPLPPCAYATSGAVCKIAVPAPIVLTEKVSGDSFDWNVGTSILGKNDNITGEYFVEVCMGDICDQSDKPVTIKAPSTGEKATVTVTSPNGGEIFTFGTSRTISWNSYIPYQTFAPVEYTIRAHRQYECSPGMACIMIAYLPVTITNNATANTPTGGTYTWNVGSNTDNAGLGAGNYKIEVCVQGSSEACDWSDQNFTIK